VFRGLESYLLYVSMLLALQWHIQINAAIFRPQNRTCMRSAVSFDPSWSHRLCAHLSTYTGLAANQPRALIMARKQIPLRAVLQLTKKNFSTTPSSRVILSSIISLFTPDINRLNFMPPQGQGNKEEAAQGKSSDVLLVCELRCMHGQNTVLNSSNAREHWIHCVSESIQSLVRWDSIEGIDSVRIWNESSSVALLNNLSYSYRLLVSVS